MGELSHGDEIIGLSRAFIYAGTPSIVASLWAVDDAATAGLMESFYRHLRAGYGKAEALRGAQLEMMTEKGDAYYWAGFSLVGDWGLGKEIETGQEKEPEMEIDAVEVVTSTVTQVVAEPMVTPESQGGRPCAGPAALLIIGLTGVWLKGRKNYDRV